MDPLLDEIIILTLLRTFPEFMLKNLRVYVRQEAYGPSNNEGLCHESCSAVSFNGDLNGSLYFCLDGYTKIKILPRIAEHFHVDPTVKGMASSVMMEFSNQLAAGVLNDLEAGGYNLQLDAPVDLSHKLVPFDLETLRQYIMIFFLADRREKEYLGRAYLILTMKSF